MTQSEYNQETILEKIFYSRAIAIFLIACTLTRGSIGDIGEAFMKSVIRDGDDVTRNKKVTSNTKHSSLSSRKDIEDQDCRNESFFI